MRKPKRDRSLGEHRRIPRRDFLQGMLVGAAGTLSGSLLEGYAGSAAAAQALGVGGADAAAAGAAGPAPQDLPGYYPPRLTGMRGSHPGSFEAAHALRDGKPIGPITDTRESYDLIVVGGGLSGLAATHFFRARTSGASRVLILDNHDDFGGHAKRNEFLLGGRLELLNGGTLEIDSPRPYGPTAAGLLRDLGIDPKALSRECEDEGFYGRHGLGYGAFFDRETFGADKLVVGFGSRPAGELFALAPLSARAKADMVRLEQGSVDYLPGLTGAQKKDRLSRISYREFLLSLAKVDVSVANFYQARTHGEWGVGIDAVSALDVWAFGVRRSWGRLPGFEGMKLPLGSIPRLGYTPSGYLDTGGSATFHFPDGNASIARLLVRSLIPEAVPGSSVRDVVTAQVDYARLDRAASPVRVRLSATAVRVKNVGDSASAREVEVTYIREGRAFKVQARGCVLACWNMMIPYLCAELPEAQKTALHHLVKTPLVYTSVAIANWSAFQKLGIAGVYAPGGYHSYFHLNPKVDIGAYRSVQSPAEPILVHMVRTPCKPGLPEHEQNKAGRSELLATPFATFERQIREQLARTLGAGGFDPARDITAITVNRWPHGYAPEYNPLWDPEVPESQRWNVIGRARFGRITIANSDAGAAAYTDSAIDQASRAVNELLSA
jgi:spermidine dehydrogenase